MIKVSTSSGSQLRFRIHAEATGWCDRIAYLLLVMQALVVVVERGEALGLARGVVGVAVGDVAGEDFLPEGKAAGGTCGEQQGASA